MYPIQIYRVLYTAVLMLLSSLTWTKVASAETQLDFIARQNFKVNGNLVAVGDFNGDRRQDVVTARTGTVSILLANRDGSLQPPRDIRVVGTPSAAAVGDFNGDGYQDLATVNGDSGTMSIVLGRADASFRPGPNLRMAAHPNSIAVGDFNEDARPPLPLSKETSHLVFALFSLVSPPFLTLR